MIATLYRILKIIKKKQFNKNFGKRVGEAMDYQLLLHIND